MKEERGTGDWRAGVDVGVGDWRAGVDVGVGAAFPPAVRISPFALTGDDSKVFAPAAVIAMTAATAVGPGMVPLVIWVASAFAEAIQSALVLSVLLLATALIAVASSLTAAVGISSC